MKATIFETGYNKFAFVRFQYEDKKDFNLVYRFFPHFSIYKKLTRLIKQIIFEKKKSAVFKLHENSYTVFRSLCLDFSCENWNDKFTLELGNGGKLEFLPSKKEFFYYNHLSSINFLLFVKAIRRSGVRVEIELDFCRVDLEQSQKCTGWQKKLAHKILSKGITLTEIVLSSTDEDTENNLQEYWVTLARAFDKNEDIFAKNMNSLKIRKKRKK